MAKSLDDIYAMLADVEVEVARGRRACLHLALGNKTGWAELDTMADRVAFLAARIRHAVEERQEREGGRGG